MPKHCWNAIECKDALINTYLCLISFSYAITLSVKHGMLPKEPAPFCFPRHLDQSLLGTAIESTTGCATTQCGVFRRHKIIVNCRWYSRSECGHIAREDYL